MQATAVKPVGTWTKAAVRDTITLAFHDRYRRRLLMHSDSGFEFLLNLPEAVVLQHNDGLLLDDGTVVLVQAAPEPLLRITAQDALSLLRLTWHLGNRHVQTQITENHLLIRRDHVLATMVAGLGGITTLVEAPFTPESGAYAGSHGHSHDHRYGLGDHEQAGRHD